MGVVNITPDSFSDGGCFFEPAQAIERSLQLVEEGADVLDLGGESSRPGAAPVPVEQELERVIPVLQEVRRRVSVPISVDTYKSEVAREAFRAGADIINDISSFRLDSEMPRVVSQNQGGIVMMHMRGTPQSMQQLPPSPDILKEVHEDLKTAVSMACKHGIGPDKILLDPGIGFGKTAQDNLRIINQLPYFGDLNLPILIGTSRKSFLGKILDLPVDQRLFATAASVAVSIIKGAHVVRVHDVRPMLEVIRVTDAIVAEKCPI